jgi:hypothetical protein
MSVMFFGPFWSITEEERAYGDLTKDGTTEHIESYLINVSIMAFENRMISCRL